MIISELVQHAEWFKELQVLSNAKDAVAFLESVLSSVARTTLDGYLGHIGSYLKWCALLKRDVREGEGLHFRLDEGLPIQPFHAALFLCSKRDSISSSYFMVIAAALSWANSFIGVNSSLLTDSTLALLWCFKCLHEHYPRSRTNDAARWREYKFSLLQKYLISLTTVLCRISDPGRLIGLTFFQPKAWLPNKQPLPNKRPGSLIR